MASGLPTITVGPPAAGRDRARRTRRGCTSQEADPAALAAAIERLAGDAPLRRRMGANARAARGRALLVGHGTARSSRRCSAAWWASGRGEDRPGQRGVPAAGGRRRLVHARPRPRAARRRPRRHGGDHEPGAGRPRRPRRPPPDRSRPQAARRAARLRRARSREMERDVVHAQHSLSALGALSLDDPSRVAVTVRDHWPVCFWSTRISQGALCPGCGPRPMTRCVRRPRPRARTAGLGADPVHGARPRA